MTPIDELIEFIETHGNGTSDRYKVLTVNDIYKYAQALQLLQPDVIKSVTVDKYYFDWRCSKCGKSSCNTHCD